MKAPLTLQQAESLAKRVVEELTPHVARVEVAGSVRRHRPVCNDIDLIVLPKHGEDGADQLRRALHNLTVRTKPDMLDGRVVMDGPQHKKILLRGSLTQVDLWMADYGKPATGDLFTPVPAMPCNFGALLLTYTGSKEHNIHVVETAKSHGWKWHPSRGLMIFDGPQDACSEVVSTDEAEIFRRLFGCWIPPEAREIHSPV